MGKQYHYRVEAVLFQCDDINAVVGSSEGSDDGNGHNY